LFNSQLLILRLYFMFERNQEEILFLLEVDQEFFEFLKKRDFDPG
jgi:hypothetical protein